ncbi:putative Tigger transposable element-derived protein 1-like 312 [Homarus americanus]|uniref:Putative Tigger transposable element-derived protein 1-like 312 n=1 Tax=Homarus americanus TaxID=6706 RepID=A0A8J5MYI2_HOMAM|nr:putative Tigger transposable element-derived protein 1-like 312 [Homarus americanus]
MREVKDCLQEKGLEFKVLLVIDNCPGHPEALEVDNKNVKAKYVTHTFSRMRQALDDDTRDGAESVQKMWKRALWPEVVNDFADFPTVDQDVQYIVQLACQVGGEGFDDLQEEEELLGHAGEELAEVIEE